MARDEVLGWLLRFARAAAIGLLDLAAVVLIFAVVLPGLISLPQGGMGLSGAGTLVLAIYLLVIAARGLKGTVLEPVFRSSALLLGFILTMALVGEGVVNLEYAAEGASVTVEFDAGPLYGIILGFLVLPSIAAQFITYLINLSARG
ncbi:hypothetical protein APE_2314 [Aeropyrum pernix K1]|uniref:Uncharacterized protein n=1 Tax=Aeropyrum pernix (strain ATCC 700893 / DSM 11879 / JCM 9820 / NBRC 100138 / K1) TaxID=272557 RepID=Q9Y9H4_AERPE|nr:hypothetical protein [Aeropyrum pernix]BAA81326.1 hypothetical protein APE_2314 [Aeropyrum pernix K1]